MQQLIELSNLIDYKTINFNKIIDFGGDSIISQDIQTDSAAESVGNSRYNV